MAEATSCAVCTRWLNTFTRQKVLADGTISGTDSFGECHAHQKLWNGSTFVHPITKSTDVCADGVLTS